MAAILLDTHAWVWSLKDDLRLSGRARQSIERAEAIFVSPVSFFEIGLKVRAGKWPDMEPLLPDLHRRLVEQEGAIAAVSADTALLAAALDWPHRDPFDRLIAATAIVHRLTLISIDTAFDGLTGRGDWAPRIW